MLVSRYTKSYRYNNYHGSTTLYYPLRLPEPLETPPPYGPLKPKGSFKIKIVHSCLRMYAPLSVHMHKRFVPTMIIIIT